MQQVMSTPRIQKGITFTLGSDAVCSAGISVGLGMKFKFWPEGPERGDAAIGGFNADFLRGEDRVC
jgi:hypothetical protein